MPEFPHTVETPVTDLCAAIYTACNSPKQKAHVVTRRSLYRTACPHIRPVPLTSVLTSAPHATQWTDAEVKKKSAIISLPTVHHHHPYRNVQHYWKSYSRSVLKCKAQWGSYSQSVPKCKAQWGSYSQSVPKCTTLLKKLLKIRTEM